jgi:hypothetical protein
MDSTATVPTLQVPATELPPPVPLPGTSDNLPSNIVDAGDESLTRVIRIVEDVSIVDQENGELAYMFELNRASLSTRDSVTKEAFTNFEHYKVVDARVSMTNAEKFSTAGGVLKVGMPKDAANTPPTDPAKLLKYISSITTNKNISARAEGASVGFSAEHLMDSPFSMKYINNVAGRDINSYQYPPLLVIVSKLGSEPKINFQLDILIKVQFFNPLNTDDTVVTDSQPASLDFSSVTLKVGDTIEESFTIWNFDSSDLPADFAAAGKFQPLDNYVTKLVINEGLDSEEIVRVTLGMGDFDMATKTVTCPFIDQDFTIEDPSGEINVPVTPFTLKGTILYPVTTRHSANLLRPLGLKQDYAAACQIINGFCHLNKTRKNVVKRFYKKNLKAF